MTDDRIRQVVLDMVKDGGLQVETYINRGNYEDELVTVIGTNLGELGYEKITETREKIDLSVREE